MKDDAADNGDLNGHGSPGLAGYEYPVDVSVWLALDLVVASRFTNELVLEPEGDEDVEADLNEYEPGRVANRLPIENYRLVVQAKLRSGNAWTQKSIRSCLSFPT